MEAAMSETTMKRLAWLTVGVVAALVLLAPFLVIGVTARAQDKAASAPAAGGTVANPVSTFVKGSIARYEKNMVAAAEAMPADKYNYKPTPEQSSFGHLAIHIAESNNTFCSKISGQAAPEVKLAETDTKDKLVAAIKDSFSYCSTALANVDDSKLGEQFVLFGTRSVSRGGALVILAGSWADHYSTEAIYLRLNGILPPTAQQAAPAKKD
jgi:DinB superfamily